MKVRIAAVASGSSCRRHIARRSRLRAMPSTILSDSVAAAVVILTRSLPVIVVVVALLVRNLGYASSSWDDRASWVERDRGARRGARCRGLLLLYSDHCMQLLWIIRTGHLLMLVSLIGGGAHMRLAVVRLKVAHYCRRTRLV